MAVLRMGSRDHRGAYGILKPVSALQTWLNDVLSPNPPLAVTGVFDQRTKEVVQEFQRRSRLQLTDGVVGGQTWKALGKQIGTQLAYGKRVTEGALLGADPLARTATALAAMLTGLNTRGNSAGGSARLRFDRATFFSRYMERFKGLDAANFAGLDQLLTFIEQDPDVTDVRWAAYMLTTVWFECGQWVPREERHWAHQAYGKPVTCNVGGKQHTHIYYGRGYVQLTWRENYRKLSAAVGLGNDELVHKPERVLEPAICYRIMSLGMRQGLFRRGHTLGRYIAGERCDYYHARLIINGITTKNQHKVQQMVAYAQAMEEILIDSLPFAL